MRLVELSLKGEWVLPIPQAGDTVQVFCNRCYKGIDVVVSSDCYRATGAIGTTHWIKLQEPTQHVCYDIETLVFYIMFYEGQNRENEWVPVLFEESPEAKLEPAVLSTTDLLGLGGLYERRTAGIADG